MIDPKDLRPMKASELQTGGVFYLKDAKEKDKFHRCQIFSEELKNEERKCQLRLLTEKYAAEGRLFVRINAPFKSFM